MWQLTPIMTSVLRQKMQSSFISFDPLSDWAHYASHLLMIHFQTKLVSVLSALSFD